MILHPLQKCPLCGSKTNEPSLIVKDSRVVISGSWAFHLQTTHGVPVEITVLKAKEQLKDLCTLNNLKPLKVDEEVWLKVSQ